MSHPAVLAGCAAITAAIQLLGFATGFALQTEVFYDVAGGVNSMAVVAYALFSQEGSGSWTEDKAKVAATVAFVASRGWLLLFLGWRAHERGGDVRFDGVKDKFFQFLTFWVVQGVWCFTIALPVLFINSSTVSRRELSGADTLLAIGFASAVVIEVVADVQKAIWVKAGRPGGFCRAGIWSFSRHPNYFGEMLQWWCAWGLAYGSSSGVGDAWWWASMASPVFTMYILLNLPPTGVYQANGKNLKRYYDKYPKEYAEYRQSTSILLPMVGYSYVPMFLKRAVFFDWAHFEYRPTKAA